MLRAVDIGLSNQSTRTARIAGVTEDRFHTLWIAAPTALYRRWPDGSTARYTTRDGLPGIDLQNVYEDRAGHFWVATHDAGLPASRRMEAIRRRSWTAGCRSSTACRTCGSISSSKRPMVASGWRPLADWWSSSRMPTRTAAGFTRTPSGTASRTSDINALTEDHDGNLWLGASNAGAMKLARDGFTTYGQLDGIHNVNAIFAGPGGNLCFRGYVLGDARGGASSKAPSSTSWAPSRKLHTRVGCFDGQRFDWFEPDAVKTGAGSSKGRHAAGSQRRLLVGHGARRSSASRPRPGSPTSRRRDRSRCTQERRPRPVEGVRAVRRLAGNIWICDA